MNDVISQVVSRDKTIQPLVRFDRIPKDDVALSRSTGRYMAKDEDYVYITPPYSRDEVPKIAKTWLAENDLKMLQGKLSASQAKNYRDQYEAWKNGQEVPPEGTPIRGWSAISPAKQAMLIDRKIMTVELLANANDEGLRSIGMGGTELRKMAQTWLAQANNLGPLTLEMDAIKKENDILKGSIDVLMRQVNAMQQGTVMASQPPPQDKTKIDLSDILPDDELPIKPPKKKR
jgi:hypothetical protein